MQTIHVFAHTHTHSVYSFKWFQGGICLVSVVILTVFINIIVCSTSFTQIQTKEFELPEVVYLHQPVHFQFTHIMRSTWPLNFNHCDLLHGNLISSSLSPGNKLWRNSLKVNLICHVQEARKQVLGGHRDLWPSGSNQLICDSKWTFVPNLRGISRRIPRILHSRG